MKRPPARVIPWFGFAALAAVGGGVYGWLNWTHQAPSNTGVAIAAMGILGAALLSRQARLAGGVASSLADLVIDHAESPIVVTDGAQNILRFNLACATLSGFSMAELGDPARWHDMVPPEERKAVADAVDARADASFPRSVENHWITRSGERRLLRWKNSALRDAKGRIYAIVSVGTDITESRIAEMQSRRSENALRRAHRIARLGHWSWSPKPGITAPADDSEGHYHYSSEAAAIYGLTSEFLDTADDESYGALIHAEDRPEAMQVYRNFFANPDQDHLTQDYRIRRPDGTFRHIRVMSQKLRGPQSDVSEVTGIVQDLTEIRRAELAIRQVQMILTAAQKLAGIGYWFWENNSSVEASEDAPTTNFHYSPEAQAVSGISEHLMQTLSTAEFCRRFVHENDRAQALDVFSRFTSGETDQYTIEYGYLHPHLGERVLRSVALRERDSAGHALHATGMIQDITDIRRGEGALRDQQHQLAAAHQLAKLGYWSWIGGIAGSPLKNSVWSREAAAITGIDSATAEAAMLADTFEEQFVHPDDLLRLLKAIGDLREQRVDRYDIDYRLRRPQGGEIWVRSMAEHRKDGQGRLIGAFGILQDISERKRAEAEVRQAHQSLANAQRIAHVGNWYRDMITGQVYWSDEVFRILGFEPRAFTPSLERLLQAVHATDRRKLGTVLETCIRELTAYVTDHRIVRPDGSIRHVRELGEVSLDSDGKLRRLEGVVLDITEIKAREAALNEARLRAETADRAKTEFLGNMSHELRTPLNAVIGFADVLSQNLFGPIPDSYRDSIDAISQSGRHLLEIINDLLEMSRIESGERRLLDQPFDPLPAIGDCVRLVQSQAQREGITLTIDETGQLPALNGEERAFKQVLNNLLSNALKFTPRGGSVAVTVAADMKAGLMVAVSDTGRGIEPGLLPQLGKPFAQGESTLSRRYGGIGLGLAISRRLMDMHGGKLEITSRPGEGTRVTMIFPKERLTLG
ncbi:PAS domain-containing sensor histidine kinase [Dongia sp.]|uniref:PAS domain-containing sensor histidine kinase n=1 Tax=Dongia sp. TaxID=1977262 RepID=UPI0035B4B420